MMAVAAAAAPGPGPDRLRRQRRRRSGASGTGGGGGAAPTSTPRSTRSSTRPTRRAARSGSATPATGTPSTRATPTTAYSWDFAAQLRPPAGRRSSRPRARTARSWSPTSPRRSASPATAARPGPTRFATASSSRTARRSRRKDVKYGVARSLDKDTFSERPDVLQRLPRRRAEGYIGPYKDKNLDDLKAIETPDDKTIVFHLNKPFAGFDYLAQLPQTAPVPQAKDTGAKYKEHVVSTGPYKFAELRARQALRAGPQRPVRPGDRPDTGRKALPDKITSDQRQRRRHRQPAHGRRPRRRHRRHRRAGRPRRARSSPTRRSRRTPTTRRPRALDYRDQPDVAPFDNIHCRKAVIYAIDKTGYQRAYGGPVGGDDRHEPAAADRPGLPEDRPLQRQGQAARRRRRRPRTSSQVRSAERLRDQHRLPRRAPKEKAAAEALQQSLAKVGIKLTLKPYPAGDYFKLYAGKPDFVQANNLGLMRHGWGADWPDGFGFLCQIVDSRVIRPAGQHQPRHQDPGSTSCSTRRSPRPTRPSVRRSGARSTRTSWSRPRSSPVSSRRRCSSARTRSDERVRQRRLLGMYDYASTGRQAVSREPTPGHRSTTPSEVGEGVTRRPAATSRPSPRRPTTSCSRTSSAGCSPPSCCSSSSARSSSPSSSSCPGIGGATADDLASRYVGKSAGAGADPRPGRQARLHRPDLGAVRPLRQGRRASARTTTPAPAIEPLPRALPRLLLHHPAPRLPDLLDRLPVTLVAGRSAPRSSGWSAGSPSASSPR